MTAVRALGAAAVLAIWGAAFHVGARWKARAAAVAEPAPASTRAVGSERTRPMGSEPTRAVGSKPTRAVGSGEAAREEPLGAMAGEDPAAARMVFGAVVEVIELRRQAANQAIRACFEGLALVGSSELEFAVPIAVAGSELDVSDPAFVHVREGVAIEAAQGACVARQLGVGSSERVALPGRVPSYEGSVPFRFTIQF